MGKGPFPDEEIPRRFMTAREKKEGKGDLVLPGIQTMKTRPAWTPDANQPAIH